MRRVGPAAAHHWEDRAFAAIKRPERGFDGGDDRADGDMALNLLLGDDVHLESPKEGRDAPDVLMGLRFRLAGDCAEQ